MPKAMARTCVCESVTCRLFARLSETRIMFNRPPGLFMASEPISKLLGENPDLRPLAPRLEQIKRLQKRYLTLVPEPLATASRVCAIDGTTIVVLATSGTIGAALRQIAPRLLEGMRQAARKSSQHSG